MYVRDFGLCYMGFLTRNSRMWLSSGCGAVPVCIVTSERAVLNTCLLFNGVEEKVVDVREWRCTCVCRARVLGQQVAFLKALRRAGFQSVALYLCVLCRGVSRSVFGRGCAVQCKCECVCWERFGGAGRVFCGTGRDSPAQPCCSWARCVQTEPLILVGQKTPARNYH